MKVSIRVLGTQDLQEAQAFLFEMVETLFSRSRDELIHKDIFEMQQFYFQNTRHVLIGAFNDENKLIGTIALKSFIDRFDNFKKRYKGPTTEVGRCYIYHDMRRQGIGTQLLEFAIKNAELIGYEMLYLHTHPNLPGGYDFWSKSGFKVFCIDESTPPTIHMELPLSLYK